MQVPSDRCGFTYTGETGHAHCCYRGTWRETERCVWHAEVEDDETKPDDGPDAYTKAASTYQELEQVCAENALLSAQSSYFVRRQDIHTREHREEGRWGRWLRARVSRAVVLSVTPSLVSSAAVAEGRLSRDGLPAMPPSL